MRDRDIIHNNKRRLEVAAGAVILLVLTASSLLPIVLNNGRLDPENHPYSAMLADFVDGFLTTEQPNDPINR